MRCPILTSNKGFGFVIVLAAILATGSLGTYMLREMSQTVRRAGFARDEFKAYMLARGGVEWVKSVPLKTDGEGEDAFWENWSGIRRREFRGGVISVKVIDESARLNLSALLGKADNNSLEVLKRLFTSVGLPRTSQDAILSQALSEKGKGAALSKSAGGTLFVTLGEVRQLVGVAPVWEVLALHVTVVSNGKINRNRAGRMVLRPCFPRGV